MVAGGVVIRYKRQSALGYPAHDGVGEHIHLFGDADAGLNGDSVRADKLIEHGVGNVLEEGHNAGRYSGVHYLGGDSVPEHFAARLEAQARLLPKHEKDDYEVNERDKVRQRSRDRGAKRLISRRQDLEHKQGVERYVHYAAEGDARARINSPSLASDKVREQGADRSRHTAQHHGDGDVLRSVAVDEGVCPAEQVDEGIA